MTQPNFISRRYTLTRLLERYHGIDTYLAHDHQNECDVAIQCFTQNESQTELFYPALYRKLEMLRAIDHTNIIKINEVILIPSGLYLVTPVHPINTLQTRMAHSTISIEQTKQIINSLAMVLDTIHKLGILHGDLTPSRICFDEQDHLILTGWGIAEYLRELYGKQTNVFVGSPGYVSPEQVAGKPLTVSNDLYAFVCIAFELVTGHTRALSNLPYATLLSHFNLDFEDLFESFDNGDSLQNIFIQALHSDRSLRFSNATEFLQALESPSKFVVPQLSTQPVSPWENTTAAKQQTLASNKSTLSRISRLAVLGTSILIIALIVSIAEFFLLRSSKHLIPIAQISSPTPNTIASTPSLTPNQPSLPAPSPTPSQNTTTAAIIATLRTQAPTASPTPSATATLLPSPTPILTLAPLIGLEYKREVVSGTYAIQYNDTIFDIAAKLGVDFSYLLGVNDLTCKDRLYPNKTLLIPPTGIIQYPHGLIEITANNLRSLKPLHVLECTQNVRDASFSPDGQILAVAQGDGVYLWRVDTWSPIYRLRGKSVITHVRFSPDGSTLVAAEVTGKINVWAVKNGEPIKILNAHRGEITSLSFSPDGSMLVSTSLDLSSSAQFWQTSDWTSRKTLKNYKIYSAAFAHQGQFLALGYGEWIRVLDLQTYQTIRDIRTPKTAYTLAISPNNAVVAAPVGLWQFSDGLQIYQWNASSHDQILFTPDNLSVLIGREFYDLRTGKKITEYQMPFDETTRATYDYDTLAFSPDQKMLMIGNKSGLGIWRAAQSHDAVASSLPTYRLIEHDTFYKIALQKQIKLAELLNTNQLTCTHQPFIGQQILIPPPKTPFNQPQSILSSSNVKNLKLALELDMTCTSKPGKFLFSADSHLLSSGSGIWNISIGSLALQSTDRYLIKAGQDPMALIEPVLLPSPNNTLIADVNFNQITLWDTKTGNRVAELNGHSGQINALAFSTSGDVLASSSIAQEIILWDVTTHAQIYRIPGYTAEKLQFILNDTELLAISGDTARSWQLIANPGLSLQENLAKNPAPRAINISPIYSISPNGKYLAYTSCSKTSGRTCAEMVLNIFDMQTRTIWYTFPGYSAQIQSIAFDNQNQRIAVASENVAVIWDIPSKSQVYQLLGDRKNAEFILDMTFSPDSHLLLTQVHLGFIRFWDMTNGQAIHQLPISGLRAFQLSPDQKLLAALVLENDKQMIKLYALP